jgi:HNH endonuclease
MQNTKTNSWETSKPKKKQLKRGKKQRGYSVHSKGYFKITSGPLRYHYIHRIVAAALLGRDLRRDEEVHHRDGDKRNFKWDNLTVMGSIDHGWISAKQSWYMREMDIKLKKYWDEFMEQEEKRFDEKVQETKAEGVPYEYEDGHIQERWEKHQAATA